jgi:hypothetical protein
MRHLAEAVRNGLGDREGACIDPKTQVVEGMETSSTGDFFVRSGAGTVKLAPDSAAAYIRTRFPGARRPAGSEPGSA